MPDGCVDIIFSRRGTQPGPLKVVGTMTRSHVFGLPAGQLFFGVRFRPAMSYGFLPLPGPVITDRSLPLDRLWGPAADRLHDQLTEAASVGQCIALFEASLNRQPRHGPVQRACAWLVQNHGRVPVDDLAEKAGLSARQFRRLCVDQTGLTPKRLGRILRFRYALSQVRRCRGADCAQVALNCGYYDQAHLINEFREFSGYSPSEYFAAPAA